MRDKGMKILCKVALRHHFGVLSKKGALFLPRCLSGALEPQDTQGWDFFPFDIQEHRGPVDVFSPEAKSQLGGLCARPCTSFISDPVSSSVKWEW